MQLSALPQEIARQDFDLPGFVQLALDDLCIREAIVRQMLENEDIMVYYHSFYVVDQASQEQPGLFYGYWPQFAALLRHPNSYHRDFGLTLLANLAAVDEEDRWQAILPEYLEHTRDAKFMTALCCIRNTAQVIRCKPELSGIIIDALLNIDRTSTYPEKQKALLHYDVLVILDEIYEQQADKARLAAFVNDQIDSPSPKTRKKAKELKASLRI